MTTSTLTRRALMRGFLTTCCAAVLGPTRVFARLDGDEFLTASIAAIQWGNDEDAGLEALFRDFPSVSNPAFADTLYGSAIEVTGVVQAVFAARPDLMPRLAPVISAAGLTINRIIIPARILNKGAQAAIAADSFSAGARAGLSASSMETFKTVLPIITSRAMLLFIGAGPLGVVMATLAGIGIAYMLSNPEEFFSKTEWPDVYPPGPVDGACYSGMLRLSQYDPTNPICVGVWQNLAQNPKTVPFQICHPNCSDAVEGGPVAPLAPSPGGRDTEIWNDLGYADTPPPYVDVAASPSATSGWAPPEDGPVAQAAGEILGEAIRDLEGELSVPDVFKAAGLLHESGADGLAAALAHALAVTLGLAMLAKLADRLSDDSELREAAVDEARDALEAGVFDAEIAALRSGTERKRNDALAALAVLEAETVAEARVAGASDADVELLINGFDADRRALEETFSKAIERLDPGATLQALQP